MKKRFLAILLIFCIIIPMVGCDRFFTDYSPGGVATTAPVTKDEGPSEFTVNRKKNIITILSVFEGKTASEIVSAVVFRLNTDEDSVAVLQLPTDLYFEDEGSLSLWYKNRYAAAIAAGAEDPTSAAMSDLKELVISTLSIPIDHTTHMTYDKLIGAVDAIGGMKMNIPYAIGLDDGTIIPAGDIKLDGKAAAGLMVYSGYRSEFVGSLHIHKLLINAFISALRNDVDEKVLSICAVEIRQHMTTTINGKGSADVFLLRSLAAADPENVKFARLAIEPVSLSAGKFSVVCKSAAVDQINDFLSIFTEPLTADEFDVDGKLTSASVQIVASIYQSTISPPSVYTAAQINGGAIKIQ